MTEKLQPQKRKRQIRNAGFEIFQEKGYENTTVRDIIDEIGISKGGFYHHYSSKEELLEDIAEGIIEVIVEILQDIIEREDLSGLEKLNRYIREVNSYKIEKTDELSLLMSEMYYGGKNIRLEKKFLELTRQQVFPLFSRVVKEGIEDGSFKTDYPQEAAEFYLDILLIYQRRIGEIFARAIKDRNQDMLEDIRRRASFLQNILESALGLKEGELVLTDVIGKTLNDIWREKWEK